MYFFLPYLAYPTTARNAIFYNSLNIWILRDTKSFVDQFQKKNRAKCQQNLLLVIISGQIGHLKNRRAQAF